MGVVKKMYRNYGGWRPFNGSEIRPGVGGFGNGLGGFGNGLRGFDHGFNFGVFMSWLWLLNNDSKW